MSNEKKYTQEEINTIENEALRKAGLNTGKELNMDEMANVSGGLDTHEQLDAKWDAVAAVLSTYGSDVARVTAQSLGILPGENGNGGDPFKDGQNGIERCRKHSHDLLTAYQNSGDKKYAESWATIY